jgi:AraC family transcriptional activator of tynA and feaB
VLGYKESSTEGEDVHFSTNSRDRAIRRSAWPSALAEHYGSFAAEFGSEDFECSIDARAVGGMPCLRIAQNSQGMQRLGGAGNSSAADIALVILQLSGRCGLQQNAAAGMSPGDIAVIDFALPCCLKFDGKNVQLWLQVPAARLSARNPLWRERRIAVLPRAAAMLVGTLMRTSFERFCAAESVHEQAVADAIVGLLAANCTPLAAEPTQEGTEAVRAGTSLRSIQDYVIANLANEMLSPRAIAQAHGISERHLHRLFQNFGLSICRWIRQSRLDRCAAQFREREHCHRSITQIAFACGFNDAAHFSRLFRAEFGLTPTQYRAQIRQAVRPSGTLHDAPRAAAPPAFA